MPRRKVYASCPLCHQRYWTGEFSKGRGAIVLRGNERTHRMPDAQRLAARDGVRRAQERQR